MNIVAILQARCSSTRLPNKVLKPLLGKPMIQHQIERLNRSKLINKLVVATSVHLSDKPLIELCDSLKLDCYAGDLENVLDRFYNAALKSKADIVVRLTGDCPLIDPVIVDAVISKHLSEHCDYTSNIEPETFPDGLDVEVFSFSALKDAWENATLLSECEHVTPYIRKNTKFSKNAYISPVDYSHFRWTVDEPRDFDFVEKVYSILGAKEQYFDSQAVLRLLEKHPELADINGQIQRNEGYLKSISKEK